MAKPQECDTKTLIDSILKRNKLVGSPVLCAQFRHLMLSEKKAGWRIVLTPQVAGGHEDARMVSDQLLSAIKELKSAEKKIFDWLCGSRLDPGDEFHKSILWVAADKIGVEQPILLERQLPQLFPTVDPRFEAFAKHYKAAAARDGREIHQYDIQERVLIGLLAIVITSNGGTVSVGSKGGKPSSFQLTCLDVLLKREHVHRPMRKAPKPLAQEAGYSTPYDAFYDRVAALKQESKFMALVNVISNLEKTQPTRTAVDVPMTMGVWRDWLAQMAGNYSPQVAC